VRASAIASNIPIRGCSGIHGLRLGGKCCDSSGNHSAMRVATSAFVFCVLPCEKLSHASPQYTSLNHSASAEAGSYRLDQSLYALVALSLSSFTILKEQNARFISLDERIEKQQASLVLIAPFDRFPIQSTGAFLQKRRSRGRKSWGVLQDSERCLLSSSLLRVRRVARR
jgi:hypothetical protein